MTLIDQVKLGNITKAQELITQGVDLNTQDEYGYTALIWAASYSNPDIAKVLLDVGADKTIQDYNGHDALYWATYYNCQAIIDLLTDDTPMKAKTLPKTKKRVKPVIEQETQPIEVEV
jgi:ankyrin repeat protein